MKFTNVRSLKLNTAELLDAVEDGEEIVITYHGKPKAILTKVGEEDLGVRMSKRKAGRLTKSHPFMKLIGKVTDKATDVSANKYKYLSEAIQKR